MAFSIGTLTLSIEEFEQFEHAIQTTRRFARREMAEPDLIAELNERLDAVARFEADLAAADFADGDAGQLRGGIDFERRHIEAILGELEARERARAFGARRDPRSPESDLPARFAAAREIDCADILHAETGQAGKRSGRNLLFSCPFHADRSPSLTVYPPPRGWHCFSCGRGSDAVDLIAELKGIDKVSALRLLEAGAVGVRVAV